MGLSVQGAQTYVTTHACPSLATLTLGPNLHLDLSVLTVDMWVRLGGGGNMSASIGYEPPSSEQGPGCLFYAKERDRDGQWFLELGGWGSGEGTSCALPAPGWHRMTMTTSGAGPGGKVTFYVDGIAAGSVPLQGQSTAIGQTLWLGAVEEIEPGTALSEVASVKVYGRCLDAEEVFESGYGYLPDVAVSFDLSTVPLQTGGEPGTVTLIGDARQETTVTGVRPADGEGFVDCGTAPLARIPEGSDYTLEAWVCPVPPGGEEDGKQAPPQYYQQILGRYAGPRDAFGPECYEWSLVFSGGSYRYAFNPRLDSSRSVPYVFSGATVTLGVPQHVAISYSQSAGKATLYIDGIEADSAAIPAHNRPPGSSSSILRIGASVSGITRSTNGFQGGVIGARIWRSARTAVQIRDEASVFPVDDECLLVDYDLTDAGLPVERTGRAANPTLATGARAWQIAIPSPPSPAPVAARSALGTMRHARRVLLAHPGDPLGEAQRRFARLDLGRVVDAHAALHESRPDLLPAWLERHEGRLGLHLRGGDRGGEPLLLATDPHDDQQLYYSTVALACVSVCTQALGAPVFDEEAATVAVLSSLSNVSVLSAVNAVIGPPVKVTADTIWGIPLAMATAGRIDAVLADGTRVGSVERSALRKLLRTYLGRNRQARGEPPAVR